MDVVQIEQCLFHNDRASGRVLFAHSRSGSGFGGNRIHILVFKKRFIGAFFFIPACVEFIGFLQR